MNRLARSGLIALGLTVGAIAFAFVLGGALVGVLWLCVHLSYWTAITLFAVFAFGFVWFTTYQEMKQEEEDEA
jgi:membrane protein implicated in regulation of membrane protease activity